MVQQSVTKCDNLQQKTLKKGLLQGLSQIVTTRAARL